ncbi:hypothetical protein [Roseateles sp.]|uniref:hypothetical protein n=1 Tax=Roseateles sp. TaxID=1971397 RepID=UPI003265652C
MQIELNHEYFQGLVAFEECSDRVQNSLESLDGNEQLVRFFARYASWNGRFANGVSALTALIGDQRELFMEKGLPRAVADRSNFIASFFFDAARDEYDDHINPDRDSHRCMAQASLLGMAELLGTGPGVLNEEEPLSLQEVNAEVRQGYMGLPALAEGVVQQVFFGMGFHLGSELLADREFSIIDNFLRSRHPDLVQRLMRKKVQLAGSEHRCYAWVGVHSGHGGGVEADHFDLAVNGAREALRYIDTNHQVEALNGLKRGFQAFANHHRAFFEIVRLRMAL